MLISFNFNDQIYQIDSSKPLDISIPIDFYGDQVNVYGVEKATSKPCKTDEFIGDTRHGGSCNFEQITLIPHCNGTHTECIGHITNERISVLDCLKEEFSPAILLTVEPTNAFETQETYPVELQETDKLLTRKSIEDVLIRTRSDSDLAHFAMIIRTLPNNQTKLTKTYLNEIPPFFTTEAMQYLNEIGVKHLLCDLPSIDRIYDEGKLSNHRIFWSVEHGKFEINEDSLIDKTITELIYVSDEIADGFYLLNLQIAPFIADASPSRPLLYRPY